MTSTEKFTLVVTQETEEREILSSYLRPVFDQIDFCGVKESSAQWLAQEPAVLLLALDSVERAVELYHSLLQAAVEAQASIPHQCIVFCYLAEAESAYNLCNSKVIDDYLVFKPLHDVWRLRLAIRQAMERPPRMTIDEKPSSNKTAVEGEKLKPTILVVEDDPFTREVYEDILEANGYNVVLAPNGNDALAAVDRQLPNVIIMDVDMPGINGLEATRRLRSDPVTKGVPIIFASGHRDKETVTECVRLGASGYITKPIKEQKLLDKIKEHLPFERW